MSFNENAQLDTSQVESGGGGFGRGGGGSFPGGIQIGGGIGGLILLVLMLIFGGGSILGGDSDGGSTGGLPSQQLQPQQVGAAGQVQESEFSQCKTGADANRDDVCLIIATVNSAAVEKTIERSVITNIACCSPLNAFPCRALQQRSVPVDVPV